MSPNERYALLIDYEFCTGCHSCEMACKKQLNLPTGQWGIKLSQDGPRKLENGKYEYLFVPIPTSLCTLCDDRVAMGKDPACVHHCQARVMYFGTVDELADMLKQKDKQVMFTPR